MLRTPLPLIPLLALVLLMTSCAHGPRFAYPTTRRDASAVDRYFGTEVPDPYRWLEDDNSKETAEWVSAQNELTFRYLSGIGMRERIRSRLTALWDSPRRTAPARVAGKLWFRHNTGLQKQAVLMVQDSVEAEPRVVLDPNALWPDGAMALSTWSVAPTGRYLAYGVSPGGADWVEMHVRDLETGADLPDRVQWIKWSSAAWTEDGKGFFYARYPEPAPGRRIQVKLQHHRVYYHRIGEPQSQDRLIFELPDKPDWSVGPWVTEDGRYLVLVSSDETHRNNLDIVDLKDPLAPDLAGRPVSLVSGKDASYRVLGNLGSTLYLVTDLDAARSRVMAVDLARPERSAWRTVVPEAAEPIESALLAGGELVVQYLVDACSRLRRFGPGGEPLGEIALPGLGSVGELSARVDTPELFYSFTSYLMPSTIYRLDLASGAVTTIFAPTVPFDPAGYETRQVFATSRDGTRVPVFLSARKGLLDGKAGPSPTMLYGYGGFAISITPGFDATIAAWLELGGVWAVAVLRGGSEYGEAWHQAGMREKKQNVFDDFIAAGEHLVKSGVTSPERLGIMGGSNGGLLVAAAATQRPDLFGAMVSKMGVLDMLRFQKFSAGSYWTAEYGSAESSEADFKVLKAYSPLHNVKPGTCHPAMLIVTADHDDRVVPAHSFKFAATVQAAQPDCGRPALLRVETGGSHGYRPTDKRIAESADVLAFAARNLGMKDAGEQ